ncbi:30S ribosomal protein S7 [bacterium]|nr:30S ribosomal protein S7 [bacterium]
MPRRKRTIRKIRKNDLKYNDLVVSQFINKVMLKGKKSTAQNIVYKAFDILSEKVKEEDPLKIFKQALDNVKPILEVKSRRVGGSTYQVPMEVRSERRKSLAMKWIISYSRDRKEKTMADRLASELIDAFNKRGSSIKKKEDLHKMAEANKAFAHYRY